MAAGEDPSPFGCPAAPSDMHAMLMLGNGGMASMASSSRAGVSKPISCQWLTFTTAFVHCIYATTSAHRNGATGPLPQAKNAPLPDVQQQPCICMHCSAARQRRGGQHGFK